MLSDWPGNLWRQPYENWFWFTLSVGGGLLGLFAVSFVWRRILVPLTKKAGPRLNDLVLEPVRRPIQFIILVSAVHFGSTAYLVPLSGTAGLVGWGIFLGVLYVLLVLATAIGVHSIFRAAIDWYFPRSEVSLDDGARGYLGSILRTVTKVLLFFVALMIIFEHFDVPVASLLATAGIASLAVALAAQETLANLIAGVALLVDRPFKAGDRIQLSNGQMGDVIEIGLRSTRVLSFDNTVITIPNSEVAKAQIINLNAPTAHVKIRCTLGVAYGSDLRKTKAALMDIMGAHPDVLREPEPAVYFTEFGESALRLLFICWVADYREKFRILDELNMAINDRFVAEGIQIPFPQRDVHVRMVPAASSPENPPCSVAQ